jgi:tetratricopeptide (TPR) repeat protein
MFMGDLLIVGGRLEEAEAHYEEALVRAEEVEWQSVAAGAIAGLGLIDLLQGRYDLARERFRKALLLSQASEDEWTVLLVLLHIAALATALGEVERAGVLLGAEAGLRETLNIPLEPLWQEEWERTEHSVKDTLGDNGWARVQAEGRGMSLERIARYAVADSS